MDKLIFISSNKRELYFEDILRSLAYQENFCLKIRYRRELIKEEDLKKNSEGILIFKNCIDEQNPEFIPIRNVRVIDYEFHEATDICTIYLELKNFCSFDFESKSDNIYLYKETISEINHSSWADKVQLIDSKINKKYLYFKIDTIHLDNGNVNPIYDPNKKMSFYELVTEKSYCIKLSLYDASHGERSLDIEEKNNIIKLVETTKMIKTRLENDNLLFRTNKLDMLSQLTFISFKQKVDDKDFIINIPIKIKKNISNTILFLIGILIFSIGTGLGLGKFKPDSWTEDFSSFFGIVLVSLALSCLYHNNDKK